jgi:hypothetical protein
MNTKRQKWRVYQCAECPNTYQVSDGHAVIGMAQPRPVSHESMPPYDPCTGICPAHRRNVSE